MRIGFIGAGTVGSVLGLSLKRKGESVIAVYSRTRASAERLASLVGGVRVGETAQVVADEADLVFVTTPDDAIGGVVAGIGWRPGQGVVHCSGALSTDVLAPAHRQGAVVGSFHPLQTFASVEQGIRHLAGTTFAVEGEPPLRDILVGLAQRLDGAPLVLAPGRKVLYHVSAVIVSNYTVTLMKLATDLWREFGIAPEAAVAALLPLLRGTVDNVGALGLPDCLTGPIARGDVGTVRRHLETLAARAPDALPLYRALGAETIEVGVAKGTLDQANAERLRAMLRHPAGSENSLRGG